MRLCFSTLTCPDWSLEQIIEAAAAAPVQGIDFRGIASQLDITGLPAFTTEWNATRDALTQAGLTMPCLNSSVILTTPDPGKWDLMLREYTRYVILARQCGAMGIRVFGGVIPQGWERERAAALARRHVRQLVKLSAGACIPMLETHDDWCRVPELRLLLDELAPQAVGLIWDVEHPFRRGEDPADTARYFRTRPGHVHLKDSRMEQGKNIPTLLGEGDLPLPQVLKLLQDMQYQGWLCLETEKRWKPAAPPPEHTIPQFVQYLAAHGVRSTPSHE